MLTELITSSNPLVRIGTAVGVVFLPLYIASSYGLTGASLIAVGVVATILIVNAGKSFAGPTGPQKARGVGPLIE